VQAGVPPSEEALVELLHVLFVGVWVACEFDDPKQSTSNESLEYTWGVC